MIWARDTADLFKAAARDAYERFQPQAMIVGASCTAELIQDDPGGLARALALPIPVIPLDLPSYQKKESWGAAETFFQLVKTLSRPATERPAREPGGLPCCNILGPTALGFRHRDDLVEVRHILARLGVDVNVVAPLGATPSDLARLPDADFNVVLYPETANVAAAWLEKTHRQPAVRIAPVGLKATREFIVEVARLAGVDPAPALDDPSSRSGWWSRSVDSNYLTNKRVFVFGEANRAIAAARIASEELGFEVVGLGAYNREFAREVRAAAETYGLTALITDDYLEVERAIAEAQPELVLGTQMERHIAKRLRIACAVISAPVHVQDFPARHSPQMGFEGANVIFDTWVHPLVMGLEEHLLAMFRDDFEFNDAAGAIAPGRGPRGCRGRRPSLPRLHSPRPRTPSSGPTRPRPNFPRSRFSCAARRAATPRPSPPRRVSPPSSSTPSMTPAATSRAEALTAAAPVRVVVVTLDKHLSGVFAAAGDALARDIPGLELSLHAATDWAEDRAALARCTADIARGDVIIASMLFMEDHVRAVLPALEASDARPATRWSA